MNNPLKNLGISSKTHVEGCAWFASFDSAWATSRCKLWISFSSAWHCLVDGMNLADWVKVWMSWVLCLKLGSVELTSFFSANILINMGCSLSGGVQHHWSHTGNVSHCNWWGSKGHRSLGFCPQGRLTLNRIYKNWQAAMPNFFVTPTSKNVDVFSSTSCSTKEIQHSTNAKQSNYVLLDARNIPTITLRWSISAPRSNPGTMDWYNLIWNWSSTGFARIDRRVVVIPQKSTGLIQKPESKGKDW